KVDIFCTGGGEKTIILLVMIFLMAGAFYSLTIDIGARDATVNWALMFVPTVILLPGLFIISCFISFAMGTSMGTITAIVPIGIGLAESIGIPVPLAIGIVIGGAMFGDNLSFISDTTIAATRTQGVKLRDKFKANLIIVMPAALLTFVALMFVEFDMQANIAPDNYE
ncbi:MAG: Na+/H+ antiporter NhaC family protein, partial [Hyphomicrobiales bacterium]|nr:Na+/H+ antiporter NhaC family protein [Hyphomicrobiales bacterium]